MSLTGDHVVRISEIPSARWDLAIDKIADGGPMTVLDTDPPVGIQRYVGWPGADGRVHVSIFTTREPSTLDERIATRDVTTGLQHLAAAVAADPRLHSIFMRVGVVREYVYDYGHGAVAIGEVLDDGSVQLH